MSTMAQEEVNAYLSKKSDILQSVKPNFEPSINTKQHIQQHQ